MVVYCKDGCLCENINKEYCCVECENFSSCKDRCPRNGTGLTKDKILKNCVNSYSLNS